MLAQVTSSEVRVRLFRLPSWRRSSLPAWPLCVELGGVPGLPTAWVVKFPRIDLATSTPSAWLGWCDVNGRQFPVVFRSASAVAALARAPGLAVVALASAPPPGRPPDRARGLALGDDARGPQGGLALGRGGRPLPDGRRRGQDHPSSSTALRRGWCASSGASSSMTDSGSGLWLTNSRNAHARRRTDLLRPTTKELPV
jgi:hypothetical protein